MYVTPGCSKVGRVKVEEFKGSYRLRWTLDKKTYSVTIGRLSDASLKVAMAKATQIDLDIMTGQFDTSLVKYDPKRAQALEVVTQKNQPKTLNIKDCWEKYKQSNKETTAKTTQKTSWRVIDNCLAKLSAPALELSNSDRFFKELLENYSSGTLKRVLASINAALNSALADKLIANNPLKGWQKKMPKQQKESKKPQAWNSNEIQAIIEAFNGNQFNNPKSVYQHSYYLGYITFLALTGCRPEEAIALTWDDIKVNKDKVWVRFNKAFSKGILLDHTKTYEIRLFPCNGQLIKLLNSIPRKETEANLVFPSVEGKYIDQNNFQTRIFKPIINALHSEGKISKVLTTYHLRHSFITRLVRSGMDIATVASLAGNSPEVIVKNYLGVDEESTVVPEL